MKMIATCLVVVLAAIAPSYGKRIPVRDVTVKDNGLVGYIARPRNDQGSGLLQGHNVRKRSPHGPYLDYGYFHGPGLNDDELLVGQESRHGNLLGYPYNGQFHSFLPYPPPHHGPHPGAFPPPFGGGNHHRGFPGHVQNGRFDKKFDNTPCRGPGCNHGFDSREHGFGSGEHGFNSQEHGFNSQEHGFNSQEHGHEHGPGCRFPPGHGFGHQHGHGHGHGRGHGHGHGYGPPPRFNDNDNSNGSKESMEFTDRPQTTSEYVTPVIPSESTTQGVTKPSTTTTSAETTYPTYDIDVRLGENDRK